MVATQHRPAENRTRHPWVWRRAAQVVLQYNCADQQVYIDAFRRYLWILIAFISAQYTITNDRLPGVVGSLEGGNVHLTTTVREIQNQWIAKQPTTLSAMVNARPPADCADSSSLLWIWAT